MLASVIFAGFISGCFAGGFVCGIWIGHVLAQTYKRNAAVAVAQAVEEARQRAFGEFEERRERLDKLAQSPDSGNVHEDNESFEESIARLYPDDPEAQEAARRERAKRTLGVDG